MKMLQILLVILAFISCHKKDNIISPNNLKQEIMVVSEEDSNGVLQLFIRNIDGSNPTQLTFNSNKSWMPAISPIGDKIAYVLESSTSSDIYVINVDGSCNQILTTGGLNITPTWTPDGAKILYTHTATLNGSIPQRILHMDADGSNKKPLISDSGQYSEVVPTISPDGSQVAFASDRSGENKYEIWKVNMNGTNLTRLTTSGYDELIQGNIQQKVPSWSPDGNKIALWQGVEMSELNLDGSERDQMIFNSWKVCVMNTDGTGLTAVDFGDDPTWSNDGQYILHPDPINRDENLNGAISVKILKSDGTNIKTLFKTSKNFGRMDVGIIE